MYEQFYRFISKLLIDFLKEKEVKPGEKLELKLNTKEEIEAFNEVLSQQAECEDFIYKTPHSEYRTICLDIKGTKMIIASDIRDVKTSFLASLRNLVGTDHPLFKDAGVIFIHNSSLDTLISGADKLQKEGMPLHYKHIEKHIQTLLQKESLDEETKAIVKFILGRQSKFNLQSANYLAEYREIIQVLAKGKVDANQYERFGLFYDSTLKDLEEKERKGRLEENARYYEVAHNYHELNIEDPLIEKDFDKKGVNLVTSDNWKYVDYKILKASSDKQKNTTPIEYIEDYKGTTKDGLSYWEKPSSDTVAGRRTRHIIVFNPEGQEEVQLEFKFSQTLKKTQCDLPKAAAGTIELHGKTLRFIVPSKSSEVTYSKFKYKDKKNYEFRILVVPFEEEVFQDLKTCYSLPTQLKEKSILIQKDEAVITLGKKDFDKKVIELELMEQIVQIDDLEYCYMIKSELDNPEGDPIKIGCMLQGVSIQIILSGEPVKPKPITAIRIEQLKREHHTSFSYHYNEETDSLKIFLGTNQYFAQEELLKQLKLEMALLQSEAISHVLQGELVGVDLVVAEKVSTSYKALLNYYVTRQLLPTLACMTQTLQDVMVVYVKAYQEALEAIEEGSSVKNEEKQLLQVGAMTDPENGMILWSPLHPLNVAYALQKYQMIKDEQLEDELLKKLTPLQLVPYIKDDENRLYRGVEKASGTWLRFDYQQHMHISKSEEVIKLIEQTLNNFREQFKYLFHIENYPLTINVFEVGEGSEVIAGVLRYLVGRYKVEENQKITPIYMTYYTKEKGRNLFHEIGHEEKGIVQILETYLPNVKEKDYPLYIKLLRDQLSVYKGNDECYQNAHISFVTSKEGTEVTYRNMAEIDTSLCLQGLAGGISAYTKGDDYIETIGMKGIVENPLMCVVRGIHALTYIGNTSDPYDKDTALALVSPQDKMNAYGAIEERSDWTVYIEPKAEYGYFAAKEGCMIHYVNRTSSAGVMSAVTLSKKVPFYTEAIWQRVKGLGIEVEKESLLPMIQLANVLNGEWLVELLAFKKSVGLESIHIVPLLKWARQYLDPTYQYWIPMSVHELLRTCEGLGIKGSKGLLSAKNYERYINDLLWVGYRIDGTQIDVSLYPMQVTKQKITDNLYKELKSVVEENTFESRYFRQLILQKATMIGKLLSEKGFFPMAFEVDQQVVAKLINEQYQMTVDHQGTQGLQAMVYLTDSYKTEVIREKNSLVIHTNLEAIWLEALDIQKLAVDMTHSENEEEVTDSTVVEGTEVLQEEPTGEQIEGSETCEEPIEQSEEVPLEAQYSIVYYMDEVSQEGIRHIECYLKQGIKPYLILRQSEEQFEHFAGIRYEWYKKLVKKQVMTMLYNIDLGESFEEPYIADMNVTDSAFYQALQGTSFNDEQYEIEHAHLEHHLSVKAGAGTGKTKVMIDRIMYIKHMRPATRLEDIAMITFTNESTMEMRQRLANRIGAYYEMTQDKKYLDWMDELASMKISTIHAFAKDMISMLGDELGLVGLGVKGYKYKKTQLIEEAIDTYRLTYSEAYKTFALIKHHELVKMILVISDYLDNRGIALTSDKYQVDFGAARSDTQHFFKFVLDYTQEQLDLYKKKTNTCEINDLIKKLRELTSVNGVKEKCRFEYVMVDEFQDTDEVQVEFIAWLTNEISSKLFVVGDIKQSIYRFRGADYTAFRQIEEKLKTSMVQKKLIKNYRSDKKLMASLNNLFAITSEHILQFEFQQEDMLEATQHLEAAKGVQIIKKQHDEEKFVEVKNIYLEHKDQGTVCALVRTNKQLRELADVLAIYKVPVIAKVKGSFYTTQAVRDFYQFVRVLLHPERVGEWIALDSTTYGTGKITPSILAKHYSANEQYALKLIKESGWYQEITAMSEQCKYVLALQTIQKMITRLKPSESYAKRYYLAMCDAQNEEGALKQVALHKAKEYEANLQKLFYILQKQFTDDALSLDHIEKYLKVKIATDRTEEAIQIEDDEKLKALRIMTVHQSKGLEFETVVMPYTKRPFDSGAKNECIIRMVDNTYHLGYHVESRERSFENNHYGTLVQDEVEEKSAEETRLFYVACTRAKRDLYILTDVYPSPTSRRNSWQDLVTKR